MVVALPPRDLGATSPAQRRRSMPSPPSARDGARDGGGGSGGARRSRVRGRAVPPRPSARRRAPLRPLRLLLRNAILLHCIRDRRPAAPGDAEDASTAATMASAAWMTCPSPSPHGDGAVRSRHRGLSAFPQKQRHGELSIEKTFLEVDDGDDGGMWQTYQDVMECFGGRENLDECVVIHARGEKKKKKKKKKKIHSKHSVGSGVRIDQTDDDYDQASDRQLFSSRTSPRHNREKSAIALGQSLSDGSEGGQYCPPEWEALAAEERAEIATLLSWESLSRWDFDVVALARRTRDPLLLVGWALLCPTAQDSMRLSLRLEGEKSVESYGFREHVTIDPRTVCNFLREIEKRYNHDLPFHSNVHAADVTQTVHCLFQLMDDQHRRRIFDPLAIFSLLLAATFHDVGHPGTNNLFEQNAATELAIRYNDTSVLENMHSATGHSLLFGEEKQKEWDIFGGWSREERVRARNIMTTSILGTDMSNHFTDLDALRSRVEKLASAREDDATESALATLVRTRGSDDATASDDNEDRKELIDSMLNFLLHAADISNPTKEEALAVHWADGALAEFFAQGDKEKEMGLPVSPLCDRDAVNRPDSQIGFVEFVIRPTFELLGEIVPRVNEEVMPRMESNLEYWKREKSRQPESV